MGQIGKNEIIGVFVGIAVVVVLFVGVRSFPFVTTSKDQGTPTGEGDVVNLSVAGGDFSQERVLAEAFSLDGEVTKLIVEDIVVGEGNEAVPGSLVAVHYIGQLQNGGEFDNSFTRGEPYTFTLGRGDVIPGWDQGIVGMREGGQRILVIPASLAYGSRGIGPIPPDATLVFAVELISVE